MNNVFKPKRPNLTLLKFMVAAVVVVTVTAAVVLPLLAKSNRRSSRINCPNNLMQLGIAFRGFGIDMGGFPMVVSANTNRPNACELGQLNGSVTTTISAR